MKRRQFIKLAGMAGVVSLIYTPGGKLVKKVYGAIGSPKSSFSRNGIVGNGVYSLDELLKNIDPTFVWTDDVAGLETEVPEGDVFSPPMGDYVIQSSMDGLPNDHRFGWMHRYTVKTDSGMVPEISVSGNSTNIVPYVSIRPVEGKDNLYYVDLNFLTGPEKSSENIVVTFNQVTGISDSPHIPLASKLYVKELSASPNPVLHSESSRVRYELSRPSRASIKIYDILGRKVEEKNIPTAKAVSFRWRPAPQISSGIYILQVIPFGGTPKAIKLKVVK